MRRHLTAAVVAALMLTIGVAACSKDPDPKAALATFLALWTRGAGGQPVDQAAVDQAAVADANGAPVPPAGVAAAITRVSGSLSPGAATLTLPADPTVDGDDATATVDVAWPVAAGVTWRYATTVTMKRRDGQWRVVWLPRVIHPDLREGDGLATRTVPAQRGAILDGAGTAIVAPRPVVVVGVQPSLVTDQAALIAGLDAAFKAVSVPVDLADLPGRLASAQPDAFVTVVTLRREAYDQVRTRIRDLPGTVFQEQTMALAPTRTFARALLGTVGDVTREQLEANPGRYVVGDQVGQSGLQEEYDLLLRGTTGVQVVVAGRKDASGAPEAELQLFRAEPAAGEPLRTTLDQQVQTAAEAALAGQPNRSALVAVRVSDGAILATANGPDGGSVNLAYTASVPPGSTFKMVTTLGLLDRGAVGLDTPVDCPQAYPVQGRSFTNAGGFVLGTVPFRVDFAKSCNTAFASLAPKLGPDGLAQAAASVGIGTTWKLGTEVFTGSVAANVSDVEAAAAAFGQGQTLVSPVALAGAAASVARGAWRQPMLLTQLPGAGPTGGPGTAPGDASSASLPPPTPAAATPAAGPQDGTALNPGSVDALRTMMREVVTAGTATALADVPGDPVYVKTGTAEFDNNPANAHSWTIGWRGDIAFAVFVEKGGSSTTTAVPIVETFLRAL